MDAGKLILITGPAAVGKSTVASGLQVELGGDGALWLVVELDVFARAVSRDWIAAGAHVGRFAERGFTYRRSDDGSLSLALGVEGRRVLTAFHRSVAAIARSGVNVICETIVFDTEDWDDWSDALSGLSATWVRLGAPVAALEAREAAERLPAFQGLARGMAGRPAVGVFHVDADTSAEAAEAIVRRVAESSTRGHSEP